MKTVVSALCMALLASAGSASDLRFATEVYPPFSYQGSDGSATGFGVDQVRAIVAGVGNAPPPSIEIMPWARAIALAETNATYCAFATARTPEREQRFKWVTPLLEDVNLLVARDDASVTATNVDEAQSLPVGTQREDYTEQVLRSKGFLNIDLSTSFDLTLAKLLGRRIDLMPMSQGVYDKLRSEGTSIRSIGVLSRQQLGIACNKAMPDDLVTRMQTSLDRLITSGEQRRLQVQYGLPIPPQP